MKIAVPILLLFLWARQVLGDENPPGYGTDTDDGGYGDTDDADEGGYGGYADNDDPAEGDDGGYGYGNTEPAGKVDCLVAETIASVPFQSFGNTQETLGQGFEEAQTCNLVEDFTRGVWFQLAGNGLCYNATSLGSTYDTTIAVYTGQADCEDLLCLTQNGAYEGDGFGNFIMTSKVAFRTEVGETYYILLGGLVGDAGSFEFSVDVSVKPLWCCLSCSNPWVCASV
jgi:hypothetical protein